MNILIVPPNDLINNVLPNRLYHLAKYWQRKHTLYLLRYPRHPESTTIVRSLKYIPIIPNTKYSKEPSTYYVINAYHIYNVLREIINNEPIETIIHANILPSMFATKLAKYYNIKTVFDYLDYYPESASAYYKNFLIKSLIYIVVDNLTMYNLKNSNIIVTVSHTLKNIIKKKMKKEVYIIPNGVDTMLFRPSSQHIAKKRLGIEEYNPILLYYGSIAEWIDYETLLNITAKLKKDYKNILLLLVGKIYRKKDKEKIRSFIKKLNIERNIRIYKPQIQEKLPIFIAASNVVIAPYKKVTKNQVAPVKVFETLACKKPVILPNIQEFKNHFRNFVWYYENEKHLIDIIKYIIKNSYAYHDKLNKAYEYICNNFDWKILALRYEKLLA